MVGSRLQDHLRMLFSIIYTERYQRTLAEEGDSYYSLVQRRRQLSIKNGFNSFGFCSLF